MTVFDPYECQSQKTERKCWVLFLKHLAMSFIFNECQVFEPLFKSWSTSSLQFEQIFCWKFRFLLKVWLALPRAFAWSFSTTWAAHSTVYVCHFVHWAFFCWKKSLFSGTSAKVKLCSLWPRKHQKLTGGSFSGANITCKENFLAEPVPVLLSGHVKGFCSSLSYLTHHKGINLQNAFRWWSLLEQKGRTHPAEPPVCTHASNDSVSRETQGVSQTRKFSTAKGKSIFVNIQNSEQNALKSLALVLFLKILLKTKTEEGNVIQPDIVWGDYFTLGRWTQSFAAMAKRLSWSPAGWASVVFQHLADSSNNQKKKSKWKQESLLKMRDLAKIWEKQKRQRNPSAESFCCLTRTGVSDNPIALATKMFASSMDISWGPKV